MKIGFFTIYACVLCIAAPSFAQQETVTYTTTVFRDEKPKPPGAAVSGPDYSGIPPSFVGKMRQGVNVEEFILSGIADFRRNTNNNEFLTAQDVQQKIETATHQQRVQQLRELVSHDIDFDAKVTKDELGESLRKSTSRRQRADRPGDQIERQVEIRIKEYMSRYDKNKDDVLSYAEMSTVSAEGNERLRSASDAQTYEAYLEMDTDKDGRVTVAEVTEAMRRSFAKADLDGNSIISNEEYRELSQAVAELHARPGAACGIPALPEDARLIAIGSYEGAFIPTVTTAGQDKDMSAANIVIKPQKKPLYLVVTSHDSMLFNFLENPDQVAHVYVSSRQQSSGTVNIPKEKVTFFSRDCLRYFDENGAESARKEILQIAGRNANVAAGQYTLNSVDIYEDRIELRTNPRQIGPVTTPQGFDKIAWKEAARFNPAGILDVDVGKVVGADKVERYEVLPQQAGIAKLVHDGILRQTKGYNTFEVIKPLSRFPAGLAGAHSVKFIVAPGLPMPEGDPAHSCVMQSDGKGGHKIHSNEALCNMH